MSRVTALFLRTKHWEIFLATFAPLSLVFLAPFLFAVPSVFSSLTDFLELGPLMGIWALGLVSAYGWIWSLGVFLNSVADPSRRKGTRLLAFACVYPILYGVAFGPSLIGNAYVSPAVDIPTNLIAGVCMFYDLYFVSRRLVFACSREPASFLDYAGRFLLLLYFPVGVWFIQPRVNRLYAISLAGK